MVSQVVRKLGERKERLESVFGEMRELKAEADLHKIVEYTMVCFNIAVCMNNAKLNQAEMAKEQIGAFIQLEKSKAAASAKGGKLQDAGSLMRKRYEESRLKLQKYKQTMEE